jgi:EAL domain-containing protein (putative c-di-GMP-specific phosphodiesterase class I)
MSHSTTCHAVLLFSFNLHFFNIPKHVLNLVTPSIAHSKGARMTGFIPLGRNEFFGDESAKTPSIHGTVYFVDDMADHFHFLKPAFIQAGYRMRLVSSAREFHEAFEVANAVAVFVDVRLGDDDATDVFDILRRWSYKASLFIVSGDPGAMTSARKYAEELGLIVRDEISKPFTGKMLIEKLARDPGAIADLLDQTDIGDAAGKGWIYPVFQPKLDLSTDLIRSAEMLSRVAHPEFGVIAPQAFVGRLKPLQARQLLMTNLAHFVRSFRYNPRTGNEFRINVNADLSSLVEGYDDISALAKTYPDFYRNLVFEITEDTLSELTSSGMKVLCKYSFQGASFAIDDFGVGASSYSRLSRLPITEVKIDKSIIKGCAAARSQGIMVKSIINMAHDIGLRVVAEGVESVEDMDFLRTAGCDDLQGFLIGRPMRLEKLREFVAVYNKNDATTQTMLPKNAYGHDNPALCASRVRPQP